MATISITVTPVNDAPMAQDASASTNEDTPLNGVLVALDVENDALTYSLGDDAGHGHVVVGANGGYSYTPDANYFGDDVFTFKANDGQDDSNVATVSITVNPVNDPPVAQDASASTNEDTPLNGVLVALDVENDALTFSLGDDAGHGHVVVGADGGYSYTPEANYFGDDSFTFTANDGQDDSNVATVSITVNPVNDAPVAQDASASTNEDTPLDGVLVALDVENDALTFSLGDDAGHGHVVVGANGGYSYTPEANYFGDDSFTFTANDGQDDSNVATVSITVNPVNDAPVAQDASASTNEDTPLDGVLVALDVENDALTFSLGDDAGHGHVVVGADGGYSYTPDANYFGDDSFTFTANDGQDDSNVATVSITVNPVNDAPVAQDVAVSTPEDTPLVLAFDASDVDSAGLTFTVVDGPQHGGLELLGDGTARYVSGENFNGTDSFTYKANDGSLDSNIATVSITVTPVNDPPHAFDGSGMTDEDTPLAGSVSAIDVEGDALTFSLAVAAGHGTAVVNPDGSYQYTPDANYYGADSFGFTANDGQDDSNVATVSLTVNPVNDPPAIAPIADQTVSEGTTLEFFVPATDVDLPLDTLTFALLDGPAGATLDAVTGLFSFTPTEAQGPGSYSVSLSVTDAQDETAMASFALTVDEDSNIDAGLQANDGNPDSFRMFLDGSDLKVELNGSQIFVRPFAEVDTLTINGSTDDDTLVVDLSGGNPVPAGGVSYDGGGPGDFDSLSLTGGSVDSLVYTTTGPGEGSVSLDGALISYQNLEPVTDNLVVANRSFVFGDGSDSINVAVGDARTQVTSPTSESVDFVNPTGTVTIHAGAGDDNIVITGTPGYQLLVDAGAGNNSVTSSVPVGALVSGTEGDDVIRVSESAGVLSFDVNGAVSTLAGADGAVVDALGGDDLVDASGVQTMGVTLIGGAGNDFLIGGAGDDMIMGGAGDDTLIGGAGADLLDGGAGDDTVLVHGVAPVAYWSMNETGGSRVADAAGTPQNGSFYGRHPDLDDAGVPASLAPFGAGTSADFHDSSREYVAVAHDAVFEVADGSIQLWFNTRDANDAQTLFAKDQDGSNSGLEISLDNRDLSVSMEGAHGSYVIDTNHTAFDNPVKSNTWYQLTFTFGGGGMKLYLNGALIGSNAYTGGLLANRAPIVIGGSDADNRSVSSDLSKLKITRPFDGYIDEVAFFNVALSPEQIAQSRQRGAMGVIDPADVGTLDGTDTLVSIEHVSFTGGGVVTAGAGVSGEVQIAPPEHDGGHGAIWDWIASHLDGARRAWLDAGHRGKLGDIHEDWTEHGFNLFAHSSAKSALFSVEGVSLGGHGDAHRPDGGGHDDASDAAHGWIRVGADAHSAAQERDKAHTHSAAGSKAAPKVDWNDSCSGLSSPFLTNGKQGARGGAQPNLASFETSPSKKKSPR